MRIQKLRIAKNKKEENEYPEMTQKRKWGKGERQNNFRNEHLFIYLFIVSLSFLGPLPWHMEIPRPGV